MRNLRRKENFGHILEHIALYLSTKSQKKLMKQFCMEVQKTLFLGSFSPNFPNFFLKVGLRHFLVFTILHHCIKNQEKLMSQSREKLVTDERTHGRTNERTNMG